MRRKYGGTKNSLGVASFVLGMILLVFCGGAESLKSIVLFGAAAVGLIWIGAAWAEKDRD